MSAAVEYRATTVAPFVPPTFKQLWSPAAPSSGLSAAIAPFATPIPFTEQTSGAMKRTVPQSAVWVQSRFCGK